MQVPGPFEYERATSVDHAVGLLDRLGEGAFIVAGGHSLLPMMKLRIANPEYLIDINDLAGELGYITVEPTLARLGAMTRHREVLEDAALAQVCPIFADAERVMGEAATFTVRPERMRLVYTEDGVDAHEVSVEGIVTDVQYLGSQCRVRVDFESADGSIRHLFASVPSDGLAGVAIGSDVRLAWPRSAAFTVANTGSVNNTEGENQP